VNRLGWPVLVLSTAGVFDVPPALRPRFEALSIPSSRNTRKKRPNDRAIRPGIVLAHCRRLGRRGCGLLVISPLLVLPVSTSVAEGAKRDVIPVQLT